MFKPALFSLSLLFSLSVNSAAPLLLSGEVAARNSEVFVAPQADNWMVQIAWMIEEGEQVQPGDPVVQYNTSSITSRLEQLEASLRKVKAESRQKDLTQDLELRQAQNLYDVALLNQKKAQLDADIPKSLLSQLNYEQYQLAFTRAANATNEAKKALEVKKKDVLAEKRRSQVEIAGAENELQRAQNMLDLMTQYATKSGTALYVDHPWTRDKIRTGDSVQRGFSVLELPETDDLHVKAWLNEIDIARVEEDQRVSISFDAKPDIRATGKIVRIGNQAEPKQYWGGSNYIDVEVSIDGGSPEGLLPGMSVLVKIFEDESPLASAEAVQ